jgi:lipopolysaccharide export system ATP-binding protein
VPPSRLKQAPPAPRTPPRQEARRDARPEPARPERPPAEPRPLRSELPRPELPRFEPPRKEAPHKDTSHKDTSPSVHEIRRLLERTASQQAPVQNAKRPDVMRPDVMRPAERPLEPRPPMHRAAAEPPRTEPAQKSSFGESLRQMLRRPAELLHRAERPADEPSREPSGEPLREPVRLAAQVTTQVTTQVTAQVTAQAMREPPPRDVRSLPQRNAARGLLAAVDLQKSYGGRRVVNGVNLNVARGEAVGLLGPNGAGKTTVFYMVTGLVKADAGRIELDGNDVTQLPMYRRARLGIGYLPQEASIFRGLTVEDNILAVLEFVEPEREQRMERLNALLDEFKLHKVRKSPSIALSGGERRRCEIARSLATNPSFMLLDEPFAGIDPIAVGDIQELVTLLTERGIGVLITDHNVRETLGLVNRAYIVHSGTILMEGNPEEIVESRDVRRLYLGEEFRL